MDQRRFLQSLAVTAACVESLSEAGNTTLLEAPVSSAPADIEGHTFLCEFRLNQAAWKVYEDLRTREGALTFVKIRRAVAGGAAVPTSSPISKRKGGKPNIGSFSRR